MQQVESVLKTPFNHSYLNFNHEIATTDSPTFLINGLTEYWQQETNCTQTEVTLDYFFRDKHETFKRGVPFRGDRIKRFAAEWICYQIKNILHH